MIYLDNAATTFPKPETVYDAMMDCMKNYCANPGRAGHKLAMKAAREIYDTRENIAKLFNIDNPMNIVFTNNATESLNLAIKGVVNAGDHIITTSMEHNSVIRPIKALEKLGIENTIVQCDKDGFLNVKDLEEAIRSNTKLIVTTHASNVCGTIIPIEEIGALCKEKGLVYAAFCSSNDAYEDTEAGGYALSTEIYFMYAFECAFNILKCLGEPAEHYKFLAAQMLEMIRNKYWNPTAGIFTSGPDGSVAFKDEVWETAGEEGVIWNIWGIGRAEKFDYG